jgi:hypothetical protein
MSEIMIPRKGRIGVDKDGNSVLWLDKLDINQNEVDELIRDLRVFQSLKMSEILKLQAQGLGGTK